MIVHCSGTSGMWSLFIKLIDRNTFERKHFTTNIKMPTIQSTNIVIYKYKIHKWVMNKTRPTNENKSEEEEEKTIQTYAQS